jgi:tetratricopeptide (TPR) repeat protein
LVDQTWGVESHCRERLGDIDAARSSAERSVEHARRCDDPIALLNHLYGSGWLEYSVGEYDAANGRYREALQLAVEHGDLYRELRLRRVIAWVHVARGEIEQAIRIFEETLETARTDGQPSTVLGSLNGLAEIARFEGEAARELNKRGTVANFHLNLAQVELLDGRFEKARAQLREADRGFGELSRRGNVEHLLRLIRWTLAAGTGDWSRYDEIADHYADEWPDGARRIKDHPWLLEMVGDYASEAGHPRRARTAWQLAYAPWDHLGDDESTRRVMEKLQRTD